MRHRYYQHVAWREGPFWRREVHVLRYTDNKVGFARGRRAAKPAVHAGCDQFAFLSPHGADGHGMLATANTTVFISPALAPWLRETLHGSVALALCIRGHLNQCRTRCIEEGRGWTQRHLKQRGWRADGAEQRCSHVVGFGSSRSGSARSLGAAPAAAAAAADLTKQESEVGALRCPFDRLVPVLQGHCAHGF